MVALYEIPSVASRLLQSTGQSVLEQHMEPLIAPKAAPVGVCGFV